MWEVEGVVEAADEEEDVLGGLNDCICGAWCGPGW